MPREAKVARLLGPIADGRQRILSRLYQSHYGLKELDVTKHSLGLGPGSDLSSRGYSIANRARKVGVQRMPQMRLPGKDHRLNRLFLDVPVVRPTTRMRLPRFRAKNISTCTRSSTARGSSHASHFAMRGYCLLFSRMRSAVDFDAKCNTLGRSGSPRKDRIFLPFPPPSAAFRDAKAAPRKGKIE